MNLSKYVACICEGSAERAIIKLLLDENRLIFTWDNLLDGEILRCRNAKKFEEQHLRKGFTGTITVLRILDSRREKFKLSKAYASKIDVVNVITSAKLNVKIAYSLEKWYNVVTTTKQNHGGICYGNYVITETG